MSDQSTLFIVTGMHRSGTSVAARMLEVFNIALPGELIGPAVDNPKGFFEDSAFVDINDRVLKQASLCWDSVSGFFLTPADFAGREFDDLKEQACQLLTVRHDCGVDWAFKDPRIARLGGFWQPLLEQLEIEYKLVISVRAPSEVAGSLQVRDGFSHLKSQYLWLAYTLDALSFATDKKRLVVPYRELLTDPRAFVLRNTGFFNADVLDEPKIAAFADEFVQPQLAHHQDFVMEPRLKAASTLYKTIGAADAPSVNKIVRDARADFLQETDILDLLADADRVNRESEAFHQLELTTWTELATRREQELTELQAYARKLEADLQEINQHNVSLGESASAQQTWSEKLEGDIKDLQESVRVRSEEAESAIDALAQRDQELLSADNDYQILKDQCETLKKDSQALTEKGEESLAELHAREHEVAALKAKLLKSEGYVETSRQALVESVSQLKAAQSHHDKLQQAIDDGHACAEQEKQRLWEIIEMYRVQLEEGGDALAFKLVGKLRTARTRLQSGLQNIKMAARNLLRSIYYRLPLSSARRQRIHTFFQRLKLIKQGKFDMEIGKVSHNSLIADRVSLLGEKKQLDAAKLPELDISLVTHNSEKWIDGFHESLLKQDYPLDKLVLRVCDNQSSDNTVAKLNALDWSGLAGFHVLHSENNGFGAGHNQNIAESSNALILISNVDISFLPESLVRAVNFAVQDDENVASWELRQAPYEHPKFYDPVTLRTGWSSHACVVLRRSLIEQVGGYEERIFMYGEDVELSYRFRAAGYVLRYLPQAVVNHYTYQSPSEVKVLQYSGSTLANAYLRMRYGTLADVLGIIPLYSALLFQPPNIDNNRRIVLGNIRKILCNAPYFLRRRQPTVRLPFYAWDYEFIRDGAFEKVTPITADNKPLVSIVTRTYQGRSRFLKECMQSVAHQTYANIEHVIVEDGGDTQSGTVAEFRAAYPSANIRYTPYEKAGRCVIGNHGLEQAKGEFMMLLDDDDLLFCDHVETCLVPLLADQELGAAYCLSWDIETDFSDTGYQEVVHNTPAVHRQPFDPDVLYHHNYIPIQSILFRRTLYELEGGFNLELENLEDWNLWIRYAKHADFVFLPKTTSMYRTPWNRQERAKRQKMLDEYLAVARKMNRPHRRDRKAESVIEQR